MIKNSILSFLLIALHFISHSQIINYEIELVPIDIPEIGGIQSYAYGQSGDEWLIIGGRLDGLHMRQPFAAFDAAGNNNQIIVINPTTKEVWKQDLDNLSATLKEQLSSTNMQFHQENDHLILTGGYAYSSASNDHITFPYITVLSISDLILAIKNNGISDSNFIQKTDTKFAVTGGRLKKIDDTYYLVGGHRFIGRYNPMGPNFGPGFIQEYTNEIRPFSIDIQATDFTVTHQTAIHDELNLHRRDYNLTPQIKDGQEQLMLFSGVFQHTANVPYLYPIEITKDSHNPIKEFNQYYNHYHCATLDIYNEEVNEMHHIFFGGIAQFYLDNEVLVQDNDIPFVNTIADVSRISNNELIEKRISTQMPGFLGAGSEFIAKPNIERYNNGVIKGDQIDFDNTEIGYIFGGIRSNAPNIFFTNTGTESFASNTIYKVLIKKMVLSETVEDINVEEKLLIYPNPAQNKIRIAIDLLTPTDIKITVSDLIGKKIDARYIPRDNLVSGRNFIVLDQMNVEFGAFLYKIEIGDKTLVRKVVWSE